MQPQESKSKWHFYISLIKSGIRITAGGMLMQGNWATAGGLFIFAEVLGIVEEL